LYNMIEYTTYKIGESLMMVTSNLSLAICALKVGVFSTKFRNYLPWDTLSYSYFAVFGRVAKFAFLPNDFRQCTTAL